MDTIDKWLKSLRLHKYTHLFKSLTYDEMLNLEEKYLIDLDITKGARNKMLVSVKKLNLRQERLINMIDDLNQDNISMKEALTVLKDMLITPIPFPVTNKPNELTYLFIETYEKVARRLIESAGLEDNACHGIMAAIVDECLKHNSFTKEQKAKVASFKHHFTKEQKARAASFRQHFTKEQKAKVVSIKQQQLPRQHQQQQQQQQQLQQQQQQHQQRVAQSYLNHQRRYQFHHHYHNSNHHDHYYGIGIGNNSGSICGGNNNNINNGNHHYYHESHDNHWSEPIQQPPSLSGSLSTIGSSTSDEEERQTYKEYSLLGPGMTFELPCLRALAEKHNSRLSFFSMSQ